MRQLAIALAILIVAATVHAQQADDPFARLFSARSIRCELGKGTQASWDGGTLKVESANFGQAGQITFDSIDAKAGKGRIVGSIGAGDVFVLVTTAGLTFIEQTAFGNVNITTVFASYDSPSSRRFVAVSSRHQDVNGPFPSQYHGTCFVLE